MYIFREVRQTIASEAAIPSLIIYSLMEWIDEVARETYDIVINNKFSVVYTQDAESIPAHPAVKYVSLCH
jgi:hypothetical protein